MGAVNRWNQRLALTSAFAGGLALIVMSTIAVLSIAGRSLTSIGFGAIPGDFELIEAGTGFAVCAFLPLTQLYRGHASVTILADSFGTAVNVFITLLSDLLLFAVAMFLTWRLWFGMLDKVAYGEQTFILKFPVWWSYAGCLFGLSVWVVVAAGLLLTDIGAIRNGHTLSARGGKA